MKLEFDPTADAAYFEIAPSEVETTKEIEPGIIPDYDADGHLVSLLEYLGAAFLLRRVHRIDANALRMKRARSFTVYLTNPSVRDMRCYTDTVLSWSR